MKQLSLAMLAGVSLGLISIGAVASNSTLNTTYQTYQTYEQLPINRLTMTQPINISAMVAANGGYFGYPQRYAVHPYYRDRHYHHHYGNPYAHEPSRYYHHDGRHYEENYERSYYRTPADRYYYHYKYQRPQYYYPNRYERSGRQRPYNYLLQSSYRKYNSDRKYNSESRRSVASFPQYKSGGKAFIFSPRSLAWAAYNSEGQLVRSGRASGGRGFCPDVGRGCRTPVGTFRVTGKGGPECKSNKFPIGIGGAPMPHCMHFARGYSIHGSYEVPNFNASHGCIRVPPSDAYWLNRNFVTIGTRVVVTPY